MVGSNKQKRILESLLIHLEFLDVAAERHQYWASDISDPETENLHVEIIGLIRQTRQKYLTLIERYNGHVE